MKQQVRGPLLCSMLGALTGMGLLIILVLALVSLRGTPLRNAIAKLFAAANQPLQALPWAGELAARQDPVLSFGVMLAYWALLGVVCANILFLIRRFRARTAGDHNGR